ncbi:MAG: DUF2461 domain-containing protein [Bacteroidetes bacterium]|nr:DUF2461 domain-containing protein [Bacteroidota bacterium]
MATRIHKESLDFLTDLAQNNNREWFNRNKDRYVEANNNMIAFADALLAEMNKHDRIENASGKKSLYRIYRDVRFSRDKSPYHTCWDGHLHRATKQLRGGYYFHIEPGRSSADGGFFGPVPDDLKRIRQDIDANYEEWQGLLREKTFVQTFGKLQGQQLKLMPKGYPVTHPAIDLLRHKQFILRHSFTDTEVLGPNFVYLLSDTYKAMRPFFDYMSEVLTTDGNGESLF